MTHTTTSHAEATTYDSSFFKGQHAGSLQSADIIAPILHELLHPTSAVDIGCGTGSWLAALNRLGCNDTVGIDGSPPPADLLQIAADRFHQRDLTKPLDLNRTFDLAVCLEVAEHLKPEHADTLIDSLTNLAPRVCFSAAIPMQGGTGHHNEQWQHHWAEKFHERNFAAIDAVRPRVWADERVATWYRQNTILYIHRDTLPNHPNLALSIANPDNLGALSTVHPQLFAKRNRKPARPMPKLAVLRSWIRYAKSGGTRTG